MNKQLFITLCVVLPAIYGQAQSLAPLISPIEESIGNEWKEVNLKQQIAASITAMVTVGQTWWQAGGEVIYH